MLHIFTEVAHWMHQRGDEIGATRLFATKKWGPWSKNSRPWFIDKPPTVFYTCEILHARISGDCIELDGKIIKATSLYGKFKTGGCRVRIFNTYILQIHSDLEKFCTTDARILNGTFYISDFNKPLVINAVDIFALDFTFYKNKSFNQPLYWKTAHVVELYGTFEECSNFNQPIIWHTPQLHNATRVFRNATNFNSPVYFDTRKAHTVHAIFQNAINFKQKVEFKLYSVKYTDNIF